MRKLLAAAILAIGCSTYPPKSPEDPKDLPRLASVALQNPADPEMFCGATRIPGGIFVTARHCVDFFTPKSTVGYAIDFEGEATKVVLNGWNPDYDVATLIGPPSEYSVEIGSFREGPVTLITNRPYPGTKKHTHASPIANMRLLDKRGTVQILQSLAALPDPCAPGESGSGVFQFDKLVGVVSATSATNCVITVFE